MLAAPDARFRELLLQRRFLSLAYTPLLDLAIDLTDDPGAAAALRLLLREEYPPSAPSHREDLAADLAAAGIPRSELSAARPGRAAMGALEKLFGLLSRTACAPSGTIGLVAVVRLWGEVLVAEEFALLFPRLESLGLPREKSRFYWPHVVHDQKTGGEGLASGESFQRIAGPTHSDLLEQVLQELIRTQDQADLCSESAAEAFEIKLEFYRRALDA